MFGDEKDELEAKPWYFRAAGRHLSRVLKKTHRGNESKGQCAQASDLQRLKSLVSNHEHLRHEIPDG